MRRRRAGRDSQIGELRTCDDHLGKRGRVTSRRASPRADDAFADFLGLRWIAADRVALTIRRDLLNSAGLLLGAVSFALVDYSMASVIYEVIDGTMFMATTNTSINYVASAKRGEIVCHSRLESRRRTGFVSSTVSHEDGRLLATAIGSFSIFPAELLDRR
jgi:acyl-coenzyme A thioesterase PaaI-like protein